MGGNGAVNDRLGIGREQQIHFPVTIIGRGGGFVDDRSQHALVLGIDAKQPSVVVPILKFAQQTDQHRDQGGNTETGYENQQGNKDPDEDEKKCAALPEPSSNDQAEQTVKILVRYRHSGWGAGGANR